MSVTFTTLFEEYATNEEELMGMTNTITAHAGGGLPTIAMTTKFNIFTTVATAGDSARLPLAKIGERCMVFNLGANILDVYPDPIDVINNGNITVMSIPPNKVVILECQFDQYWEKIYDSSAAPANLQTAIIQMTNPQIAGVNPSAPFDLIPSPGAGFAIDVIECVAVDTIPNDLSGGVYAYNDLDLHITTETATSNQIDLGTISFNATSAGKKYYKALANANNDGIVENKKVQLTTTNSQVNRYISGTAYGTPKLIITYQILAV